MKLAWLRTGVRMTEFSALDLGCFLPGAGFACFGASGSSFPWISGMDVMSRSRQPPAPRSSSSSLARGPIT